MYMYSQSATYIYVYSVDVYYMMFTIHIIYLYTHIYTYLCGDEASKQEITKISFCSTNDLTEELHLI